MSRLKTGGVIVRMERDFEFGLVGQLRAGDLTAFDAIYDAYNPRLFSFLLRMTKNRAVAEDLLEHGCGWFLFERGLPPPLASGLGYSLWHAICS